MAQYTNTLTGRPDMPTELTWLRMAMRALGLVCLLYLRHPAVTREQNTQAQPDGWLAALFRSSNFRLIVPPFFIEDGQLTF